jgi:hypothetical protein
MNVVWETYSGQDLRQGDLLEGCAVPLVGEDFGLIDGDAEILIQQRDLIVVTQSCDLENAKTQFAALCPIIKLDVFEEASPEFKSKGRWENVRKGRVEGLHMLASPEDILDNRLARVVDFRQIFSLPIAYLQRHAASLNDRPRLRSPYVEHFSQAFARFFMRVGLPAPIPEFK